MFMTLIAIFALAFTVSLTTLNQQRFIQNNSQSLQAYYAAEAGVEDALLRLSRGMNYCSPQPCSYTMQVEDAVAEVTISDIVAGARTIRAEGDSLERFRATEVVFEISSSTPGFFYGAQVGDGGVQMGNNAIIDGNIFSNGPMIGNSGAEVLGTVKVSGVGNVLENIEVTNDAYVDTCDNADIVGVLYATTDNSCSYSSFISEPPPDPIGLPIPDSEIQEWQQEAEDGGVIIGDQTIDGSGNTLGPVKIDGNLQINNGAELIVTGTIWVTGNIQVDNNASVHLVSGYGSTSGTIIGDSNIQLQNGSVSEGSGSAGSYLMYVATSNLNPAIHVQNNAVVDIVYTNHGWITLENNADIRQITAYALNIQNNAVVTYEIGLEDAAFTSGPGGGWTVTSWKETE